LKSISGKKPICKKWKRI